MDEANLRACKVASVSFGKLTAIRVAVSSYVPIRDEPKIRESISRLSDSVRRDLSACGALTKDRGSKLLLVSIELAQAEAAAHDDKRHEMTNSLRRSVAQINDVLVDVMTKMG